MKSIDLSNVWDTIGNTLDAYNCPATQLVISDMADSSWPDIQSVTRQLAMASCSAGSWGGVIYTRDIQEKLKDSDWFDSINRAIEDYQQGTGDLPKFESAESMVTFAVDQAAFRVLRCLEGLEEVFVVECSADSLDTSPDCIAFTTEWEATDFVADEVQRRVSYMSEHSAQTVTEQDLQDWEEQESQLVRLTVQTTY